MERYPPREGETRHRSFSRTLQPLACLDSMTHLSTTTFLITLLAVLLAPACGDRSAREVADDPSLRIFAVQGVVQSAMDDPTMLLIDHEEIPDFMPRMIMPFRVHDPAEFEGLEPGMVVTLDFHVTDSDSWAANVHATGETGPITYQPDRGAAALLGVGDSLPDHEFLDENGTPVRLSDFRGLPLALTFVFSRCPVPEYCPRMMSHFAAVVRTLESDPDAPEAYRLLTISFDSENDTPETMNAWGAAFGHEPDGPWRLLTTPDDSVIDALAEQVGLRFGEANGTLQHNLRTLVLDREGVIRALHTDENWTVEQLVAELKEADQ